MIPPVGNVAAGGHLGAPSQQVARQESKTDKKDRRKLQLSEDAYVHGNEALSDINTLTVYDRSGRRRQMGDRI